MHKYIANAPGLSTVRGYNLEGSFDPATVTGIVPFYSLETPVYPPGPLRDVRQPGPHFTIRTG